MIRNEPDDRFGSAFSNVLRAMIDQPQRPILLLVSAPSGGGKTTVCQRMLASTPGLKRVVTCTTRPPRPGERNGLDYWFLDEKEFRDRLEKGEFLEHAVVYGHLYGTPRSEVQRLLEGGSDVLIALDVQGANSVRSMARTDRLLASALVTVFLTPPSMEELAARLQRRGQDSPEAIATRLAAARQEVGHWKEFDYLILSSTVEEDLRRMQAIYLAEKMKICSAREMSGPDG